MQIHNMQYMTEVVLVNNQFMFVIFDYRYCNKKANVVLNLWVLQGCRAKWKHFAFPWKIVYNVEI